MNQGLIYATLVYMVWGLLPIYWKTLQQVSYLEILCHRMGWSIIFMLIVLTLKRDGTGWRRFVVTHGKFFIYLVSASLLACSGNIHDRKYKLLQTVYPDKE